MFDDLLIIYKVVDISVLQNLLSNHLSDIGKGLQFDVIELAVDVLQNGEQAGVEGALAEPLLQICFAWYIILRLHDSADGAEELDGRRDQRNPIARLRLFLLIQDQKRDAEVQVEKVSLEEDFAKALVLCNDVKGLTNLHACLQIHLFALEKCSKSCHLLFLNEVNNLTAVCDYFQSLPGQLCFLLVKQLPVLEFVDNLVKNFVEVLVDCRISKAKFPSLLNQVSAQIIFTFNFDLFINITIAVLVFLFQFGNFVFVAGVAASPAGMVLAFVD